MYCNHLFAASLLVNFSALPSHCKWLFVLSAMFAINVFVVEMCPIRMSQLHFARDFTRGGLGRSFIHEHKYLALIPNQVSVRTFASLSRYKLVLGQSDLCAREDTSGSRGAGKSAT